MTVEPSVLMDKLRDLVYPSDVAEFCKERGIRGITQDDSSCALARLFLKETTAKAVRVGEIIEWSTEEPDYDWWDTSGWGTQEPTTDAIKGFIHNFDNSQYPELEESCEDYD